MNSIPGTKQFRFDNGQTRAKSCLQCQEKKRKCSRELPSCSSCRKHGSTCVYGKSTGPVSQASEPQSRLLVDRGNSTDEPTISSPNLYFSANTMNQAKTPSETGNLTRNPVRVGSISRFLNDSEPPTPGNFSFQGEQDSSVFSSRLSNKSTPKTSTSVNSPATRSPGDEVGRFSVQQLADISTKLKQELPEKPELDHTAEHFNPASRAFWPKKVPMLSPGSRVGPVYTNSLHSSLSCTGIPVSKDLELLATYLPERTVVDVLLDRYRSSVHPVIPILDLRSFYPLYEKFWNNRETSELPFYILLFTILYAASVSEYEEKTINPQFQEKEVDLFITKLKYFVGATEIALAMSDFPRHVTIVGLQATVILHSVLRMDCRTDDCESVASLVRSAQLIELNRDPLNYHRLKDQAEVQRRRLLWWQIFHLDLTSSLSSRLSPMINLDECDTVLPNEYSKDLNGNYSLDPAITFANGKFRWVECCNRILRGGAALGRQENPDLDSIKRSIDNLSFHCSSLIQRILDPANIMPGQEHFAKFSSSLLSTLADRCYILLHLAFSDVFRKPENEGQGSKVRDLSSTANVEVKRFDRQLTERQIHFLREFCKYGSMPDNAIFLWEIRKFQPIQAILSLLRSLILEVQEWDLDQNLYSYKSLNQDKKVTIISSSIEKLGYLSDHGTPMCKERWRLIRNLKEATWNRLFPKAGSEVVRSTSSSNSSYLNRAEAYTGDEISEKEWNDMLQELSGVQRIIDENINAKLWDHASGHFLM